MVLKIMNKNCSKYLLCVLERLGFSFFLMVQNVPQQRCADLLGGMDDVAIVGGIPFYFL
jgi:hypothetical protein